LISSLALFVGLDLNPTRLSAEEVYEQTRLVMLYASVCSALCPSFTIVLLINTPLHTTPYRSITHKQASLRIRSLRENLRLLTPPPCEGKHLASSCCTLLHSYPAPNSLALHVPACYVMSYTKCLRELSHSFTLSFTHLPTQTASQVKVDILRGFAGKEVGLVRNLTKGEAKCARFCALVRVYIILTYTLT
jgi:hypothetical protein